MSVEVDDNRMGAFSGGKLMKINLNWENTFQEYQDILNSGLNPEWLYSAKANMILIPAYTGKGKEFFYTSDIIKASKIIPFLDNCDNFVELFHNSC